VQRARWLAVLGSGSAAGRSYDRVMHVVVAGGHGKIALRLLRLLAERGDRACGLIRNPSHAPDLEAVGGEPVLADIEQLDDLTPYVEGADAVVFAAGAGRGSGAARKQTVDLGAAVKLIEAAQRANVDRYVMVSSVGAHDPANASEAMRPYLEAKAQADGELVSSGLDYTIVRPGSLTDERGTGRVELSTQLGRRGPITRDDAAAILLGCLDMPETTGLTFEAFNGDEPIDAALRTLADGSR